MVKKLSFWSQPNRKRESKREREREREKAIFSLRFTGFRRLDLVKSRIKADLREEGYVWVPKSQDFAKVQGLMKTEKRRCPGKPHHLR